jgi:hypothetical protein
MNADRSCVAFPQRYAGRAGVDEEVHALPVDQCLHMAGITLADRNGARARRDGVGRYCDSGKSNRRHGTALQKRRTPARIDVVVPKTRIGGIAPALKAARSPSRRCQIIPNLSGLTERFHGRRKTPGYRGHYVCLCRTRNRALSPCYRGFARRVAGAVSGSSGHGCRGYRPFISDRTAA